MGSEMCIRDSSSHLLQQPARGGRHDALEMSATQAERLRQLVLCSWRHLRLEPWNGEYVSRCASKVAIKNPVVRVIVFDLSNLKPCGLPGHKLVENCA